MCWLSAEEKDFTYKTTLKGHSADIHCMTGDRELLFTGAGDRRVLLWSLVKFTPLLLIDTGHSNRVKARDLASLSHASWLIASLSLCPVHVVVRSDALHRLGRQDGARL